MPCFGAAKRVPMPERLWPKLATETHERRPGIGPCRIWTGHRGSNGYGRIGGREFSGGYVYTHRVAYELTYGPIPPGRHILHRCDNPPCCEPTHLFLGDQSSNNEDRDTKGRVRHGEGHTSARLTYEKVNRARTLHATGAISGRALAKMFGVSAATMSAALRGDSWKRRA